MLRVVRRLALITATILSASCAEPPNKEMNQAQGAIDAARAAGADKFAAAEFTAAQTRSSNPKKPSPTAITARRSATRSTAASARKTPPSWRSMAAPTRAATPNAPLPKSRRCCPAHTPS